MRIHLALTCEHALYRLDLLGALANTHRTSSFLIIYTTGIGTVSALVYMHVPLLAAACMGVILMLALGVTALAFTREDCHHDPDRLARLTRQARYATLRHKHPTLAHVPDTLLDDLYPAY